MTCLSVIASLGAYLGRELELAERLTLLRHARSCEPCRSYLESYLLTVRLVREACAASLDPEPESGVR